VKPSIAFAASPLEDAEGVNHVDGVNGGNVQCLLGHLLGSPDFSVYLSGSNRRMSYRHVLRGRYTKKAKKETGRLETPGKNLELRELQTVSAHVLLYHATASFLRQSKPLLRSLPDIRLSVRAI
jgi:hypothetical protein